MALKPAQKTTLKAYILADGTLAPKTVRNTADYQGIVDALNADAPGPVLAWRTNVQPNELDEAGNYPNFDAIAAGKRDSWGFMLRLARDFGRAKVRKWVTDIWGAATAGSDSENILKVALENASVAENVIGGTTKTEGSVSALKRDYEGDVTIGDIAEMFNV